MIAVKTKILFIILCVFETMFLLVAQVSGSTVLVLLSLACFLAMAAYSATKEMAIPLLLYFLPFAPLLKLQPGTTSFYTLALMAIYLIYVVLGCRRMSIYHLIPGLCLIALILVVKTAYGYSIDNSFILFAFSLLTVPFIARESGEKYDFYWLTMCFSIGIIIASFTARYLLVFPTIRQYIETINILGITRYSGYYGDPNFYSAHITAALAGMLILFLNNEDKKRAVYLIVTSIALVYCGFTSVSKSFLLITVSLFLFWLVEFMFRKGKVSAKLMILLTFFVGIMFLLSTTVFSDTVSMMITRFRGSTNLSDLTTGRTKLWTQYIRALAESPLLLIFGKGLTKVLVNGRASHNTIIYAVYQLGIVGCGLLASWFVCFIRAMLPEKKIRISDLTQIFILLMGAFGPWLALDLLTFDEFFLLPVYVCIAIRMLLNKNDSSKALM